MNSVHLAANGVSRRSLLGGLAASGTLATASFSETRSRATGGWDVVVIGAGVFGAWIAWTLQNQGTKVLLVDAWGAAHSRASSGGETRLIRTEYGADPLYTRWAWQSLAEWKAFSLRHESPIFHEIGALYLYPEDSDRLNRSISLQRSLGIPLEKLSTPELAARWPQINFEGTAVGLLQPTMGALVARRSVQVLVADFIKLGGSYTQAAINPPDVGSAKLEAVTGSGQTFRANHFIFACGPWLPKMFPDVVGPRITPIRKDVFFFAPEAGDSRFAPPILPAWVDAGSPDLHYGFPDIEARGFKIALDGPGETIDPDTIDRRIGDQALANVRTYLRRRFPALADRPLAEQRVCQYENTGNRNFLIDRHPRGENVWIVGGGSGHGFKHGPAVARYVVDLAFNGQQPELRFTLPSHDLRGDK